MAKLTIVIEGVWPPDRGGGPSYAPHWEGEAVPEGSKPPPLRLELDNADRKSMFNHADKFLRDHLGEVADHEETEFGLRTDLAETQKKLAIAVQDDTDACQRADREARLKDRYRNAVTRALSFFRKFTWDKEDAAELKGIAASLPKE